MGVDSPPGRVVIITGANLRRGASGGTRTYVRGLAGFLAKEKVPTDIVANGPVEDFPDSCRVFAASQGHLPSTRSFQRALKRWDSSAVLDEARLLHFQRPDDFLAFASRKNLPPAVCTLHGNPGRGIRRRHGVAVSLAYGRREARVLSRFHTIIAVDAQTAAEYANRYPDLAGRIRVIPVAVDSPLEPRTRPRKDGHPHPTFLYAGRLSVEKRIDSIFEAIRFSPMRHRARLLVAGSGPDRDRLVRMANGMNVEFLGSVPWERLQTLYDEVDALVLASEYEGLPTVALEALSHGCPVVAVAGIGLEQILADGRGIIAPRLEELSAALAQVLDIPRDPDLINVPESYTWQTVGRSILEAYQRLFPEVGR